MTPATLSVALIARDEEQVLGRILQDAAGFSDELVVIDTGSLDRTTEIACQYGARVYDHEWVDDFAAARNASFDNCTSDWIMWLDADDRVPQPAQRAFARAKRSLAERADVDTVYVPYRLEYANEGAESFSGCINRVRMVRRDGAFRWVGRIHESLHVADAPAMWLDKAWVEHRPIRQAVTAKRERDRRILETSIRDGDRDPMVLLHYGLLLGTLKELDSAAAILEECLVVCDAPAPRYAALLMAAACVGELGDLTQRVEYLYEALDLDSRRAEAFVDIGAVHEISGDYAGAVPFYRAAVGLRPPKIGNYAAAAYSWAPLVGMARCTWRMGRRAEARRWLVKAARTTPHRIDAFKRLAAELEASMGGLPASLSFDELLTRPRSKTSTTIADHAP
jgi:glycosyltransferase involved in cell wall biosynthesis